MFSEAMLLTEYIKSIIPKDYRIVQNDVLELTPNICSVIVRGGNNSTMLESDNTVVEKNKNCSIILNTENTTSGIEKGNLFIEECYNRFIESTNELFTYSNNVEEGSIFIRQIDIIGDGGFRGKDVKGIPFFSININIKYKKLEVV